MLTQMLGLLAAFTSEEEIISKLKQGCIDYENAVLADEKSSAKIKIMIYSNVLMIKDQSKGDDLKGILETIDKIENLQKTVELLTPKQG